MTKIELFQAFPPDRESAVVELNIFHDGLVDIPAEISIENGVATITIFQPEGGVAWVFPLDEWLEALRGAAEVLEN